MNWFYDMKIATKLVFSFLVVLLLTLFLGIFSLTQFSHIQGASSQLTNYASGSIHQASDLRAFALRLEALAEKAATTGDQSHQNALDKLTEEFRTAHAAMQKVVRSDEGRQTLDAMFKKLGELEQLNARAFQQMANSDAETAYGILHDQSAPLAHELNTMAVHLQTLALKMVDTEFAKEVAVYNSARNTIIAIIVACFILGIGLAIFVASNITSAVRDAASVARRVAGGDLQVDFPPQHKDEVGQLMHALQDMSTKLSEVVNDIRQSSETINIASSEVASGNMDLSSRTEQQASSLEETASAMEQLTSTVRQNADNAQQANKLAISASGIAIEGGQVMEQVVTTMNSINESSHRIVDIISVIDGIAFQTNILALNAAVEAARAGEQGRGFAVVASEVRSLAQRSANAAKEIKDLIDSSVDNVESGSKLVEKAGATMSEVVTSIRHVTDIVSEITAASQEQSAGIEQVNDAITQMDQVTQQNAALVEEAASATQSMVAQTVVLKKAVAYFNTGATAASAQAARKAPPINITPKPATIRQESRPAFAAPAPKSSPKPVLPAARPKDDEDDWTEF